MKNNNENKILNVPNLRFPEFSEEWKKMKVSELLDFYSTNSLSWEQLDYNNGKIKNLHYGLIHKGVPTMVDVACDYLPYIKEESMPKSFTLFKEGDVAFADASEDTNDVAKAIEVVNCDNQQIVSGLHTIHGRDNYEQTIIGYKGYAFASDSFHKQIRRIAQGTKVFSISARNFDEVYIGIPSKEEQTKIAKLLIAIDKRIATQNKIIEDLKKLKSAIIDKSFCYPNESSPQKRFIGFTEEWHLVHLSDICQRVRTKNFNTQCTLVLTIAAQFGLVSQEEFFNKSVASDNLEGYYLLRKGDFAYNKSYSGDYAWGAVKRLECFSEGVLSPLYICFRPDTARIDSDFLAHYFESKKWYKGIADIAGEGARNHGLLNLSVIDYFKTLHRIPSIQEQKAIANALNKLTSKISIEKNLYDDLLLQRQHLLQQMFI